MTGRRETQIVKCEARNAVNIGDIDKFCALKIAARQSEEVRLGCNEARPNGWRRYDYMDVIGRLRREQGVESTKSRRLKRRREHLPSWRF